MARPLQVVLLSPQTPLSPHILVFLSNQATTSGSRPTTGSNIANSLSESPDLSTLAPSIIPIGLAPRGLGQFSVINGEANIEVAAQIRLKGAGATIKPDVVFTRRFHPSFTPTDSLALSYVAFWLAAVWLAVLG